MSRLRWCWRPLSGASDTPAIRSSHSGFVASKLGSPRCRVLAREEIFFTPQPHRAQHLSYPALAHPDAAGLQALAQLCLGQVRLLLQPTPQTVFRRLRDPAGGPLLRLRWPLLLPGALLLPPDLLAVRQAYS